MENDQTVIKIEKVSKRFTIGTKESYLSLRDKLSGVFKKRSGSSKDFWALKDINLDIKKGDTIGIIGRNGAGKSTLLKVLSQITPPTEGKITIDGRVASLLEVGTGFHPELTGRENIYLNGAILGMTRKEIKRKFDEIVAFSEIEKFLDTPVKRYSSGMYVRLAFAVAAHLEPEILIVDEVLAVGDAQFQKKCLGKMGEVGESGRTVLYVSHNMASVNGLCKKSILLSNGRLIDFGDTPEIISKYLTIKSCTNDGLIDLSGDAKRKNSFLKSKFKFSKLEVFNCKNEKTQSLKLGEPFEIVLSGESVEDIEEITFGIGFMSSFGVAVFNSISSDSNLPTKIKAGKTSLSVSFDRNYLTPGNYTIDISANGEGVLDWIPEAVEIDISNVPRDPEHTKVRDKISGVIMHPCDWSIRNE